MNSMCTLYELQKLYTIFKLNDANTNTLWACSINFFRVGFFFYLFPINKKLVNFQKVNFIQFCPMLAYKM